MTATTHPLAHEDCNAYCRGSRHAQLVFVRRDFWERAPEILEQLCGTVGLRFVATERAHEAIYPEATDIGYDPQGDGWELETEPEHGDAADYQGWLLVFEESPCSA